MHTILIQDTEKDILELLTIALELEGFHVYAIHDCDENLLNIIERKRPHLVVLDYRVDGARSIEAVKQIKRAYPHLPVIATSCNSNIHQVYNVY